MEDYVIQIKELSSPSENTREDVARTAEGRQTLLGLVIFPSSPISSKTVSELLRNQRE
ncbi:MAG: hypothetical protein Ct9H90mP23_3180 [Methanobacteriota archaeon]|nr:MAG: hypothetical protein Ct9H90mP23_3180 [Euryarchaeota archaeon]